MSTIDANKIEQGEPVWRIALLFPPQGSWTETDYLSLDAGRLIEFEQGCVEVLEMPTKEHQRLVQFLYRILFAFVDAHQLGEVFVAPLPVRLWALKFREPDVLFVRQGRSEYQGYPDGADLVIEVVSDDAASRRRDTVTKPAEYSQAGIAEYWIVAPGESRVSVGQLCDGDYQFTDYTSQETARSVCLPGFQIDVSELLAAAVRHEDV